MWFTEYVNPTFTIQQSRFQVFGGSPWQLSSRWFVRLVRLASKASLVSLRQDQNREWSASRSVTKGEAWHVCTKIFQNVLVYAASSPEKKLKLKLKLALCRLMMYQSSKNDAICDISWRSQGRYYTSIYTPRAENNTYNTWTPFLDNYAQSISALDFFLQITLDQQSDGWGNGKTKNLPTGK